MTRPFDLDPLFQALTSLPGIGPRNGKYLERLIGGARIYDLLCHLPVDMVDRRHIPKLAEAKAGEIVTLALHVTAHTPAPRRNLPHRISCRDDTGTVHLVFFHGNKDWLVRQYPAGQDIAVSGRLEDYNGKLQIVHPETAGPKEDISKIARVEPIYPLTSGITNKTLSRAMDGALRHIPNLPEWLDPEFKSRRDFPSWGESLRSVHTPQEEEDFLALGQNRMRLAYDELLANQLALGLARLRAKKKQGKAMAPTGALRNRFLDHLPFQLTAAQSRVLEEIDADMTAPERMMRLLQGDVGSGKTVMAALSMLSALENGYQAALMAPTEILARQHAQTLTPMMEALGLRIVTLTGRDKGKSREVLLGQIKNGAAQIVIGTHALFKEDVAFENLGMAVIDEQHRFGVHQRMQLSAKGGAVDMLVMTATPIPRTLALTAYGDMDVSRIDEKPPGRKPIDTRILSKDRIAQMIESLKSQIQTGSRIYWVCPLVEESEMLEVSAAQERFEILESVFPGRVGLVHGRMKPAEKDDVMAKFSAGEIDILVATTVIEVGVNVPEATIMVIEHAERFGLAQLHQLRGRVGRGMDKSFCFLIHNGKLGEVAKERLKIMRESEDGFLIAEKDLELRGSGEMLGTRQSGLPIFKLADRSVHRDLLAAARDDVKLILSRDPALKSERGIALRNLLYLFERDQAIRYLQSGG